MSGKSRKSASKTNGNGSHSPDRPFGRAIEKRAKAIAQRYRLILEPDEEVGYVGHALEMPRVFADGKTPNQCVREVQEALTGAVATMLEMGQTPPTPLRQNRNAQINVRVSEEEKILLEEEARRRGFRGVSDYMRTTALSKAK